MNVFCTQCGRYHESLTVCPNWKIAAQATATRVEQQELSRTTINELGAALGRIEAVIGSNTQQEAFLARLTALDERLGAIETALELVGAEHFTQIKCLLDLTNKRLKALELGRRHQAKRRQRRSKRR